jgi:hypothetical protein
MNIQIIVWFLLKKSDEVLLSTVKYFLVYVGKAMNRVDWLSGKVKLND